MKDIRFYDVLIIGGSYSGLAAAMSLGRARRKVALIDSGLPCNRQTPQSHNFITHDGEQPAVIAGKAKEQVLHYPTVDWYTDLATAGKRNNYDFDITTESGLVFRAAKVIFATGVKDLMPDIPGFAECWGISAIHCPYCHGYEYSDAPTGILSNGDTGYDFCKLIHNWTSDLTLFTNGPSSLTEDQANKLLARNIKINELEIDSLAHELGHLHHLGFKDGSTQALQALYSRIPFEQHCSIPAELGCELTETGHLRVDAFMRTNIPGIYACGDNTSMMRSVANAVGMGSMAGAAVNKELVEERF